MNNNRKHHASMLRSRCTLHQGQGRTMYISRWSLYSKGQEAGEIEVLVETNKKGEVQVLAPRFVAR